MLQAYRDEKYSYISFDLWDLLAAEPLPRLMDIAFYVIRHRKTAAETTAEEIAAETVIDKETAEKCLERLKEIRFEVIEGKPPGY